MGRGSLGASPLEGYSPPLASPPIIPGRTGYPKASKQRTEGACVAGVNENFSLGLRSQPPSQEGSGQRRLSLEGECFSETASKGPLKPLSRGPQSNCLAARAALRLPFPRALSLQKPSPRSNPGSLGPRARHSFVASIFSAGLPRTGAG